MAAPDYTRRTFDMATVRDRAPLLDPGTLVNGVTIVSVPAGSSAQLHYGTGRDPIDVVAGDSWDITAFDAAGCPVPLDEGLYLTNPAGAGTLLLIISLGPVGGGAQRAT